MHEDQGKIYSLVDNPIFVVICIRILGESERLEFPFVATPLKKTNFDNVSCDKL